MVSVDRLTTGYVGLSTDEKPTVALRNGDTFVEMDTNKLFAWDEDGGQWLEQVSAGGGGNSGGGGSDDDETTVTIFDGEIELSYNSHDGWWTGRFTPQTEPDTTRVATIEINDGTHTTESPETDNGHTTWQVDADDETLGFIENDGSYSFMTTSGFLPSSEEQFQTIPVKITQTQSSGGSESGERMIVNFSTQDGTTYTIDKTYAEIKAASDANIEIVAKSFYTQTQAVIWVPILSVSPNAVTFVAQDVYSISSGTATVVLYRCVITKNDDVSVQQMTYNATVVSA